MIRLRRSRPVPAIPSSAFAGFRFPPEILVLAVRWYLLYGLSYREGSSSGKGLNKTTNVPEDLPLQFTNFRD